MSVINTNTSALIAQNSLVSNNRAQSTAMQQLSTGLRINGAKDDAAGLAIAAKMTSQIKGLDQAVRNANDAISMLQTADGAMVAVGDMMQRMRELAVQAANDTNVSTDRTALDSEFQALKTEIGRVGATTQWNGMNILDGSANGSGVFQFQVGANNTAAQQVSVTISSIAATAAAQTTSVDSTTTYSAGGAKQKSAFTLTGATPVVGETVNLKLGDKTFSYTIQQSDFDATALTFQTNVAKSMTSLINNTADLSALYTATEAAGVLSIESKTNATNFTASSTVTGKGLTLLGGNNDLTTLAKARSSMAALDTSIGTVNTARSGFGAVINRLTYAADNLANISQNASASRSRVQDTDYAKASTELARTQIIAQAATAMLAQANQSQQSVLALLK
jgi:flagellin